MMTIPNLTFHDGRPAPQLGFGVWQIADESVDTVVANALELGYRSIDTAAIYDNETGVGRGIAQAGVPRDQLFVTTKVWNTDHGHEATRAAFNTSLEKLGLDYVDLYLIHWPAPQANQYIQTWEAMIQLRDEGRAKSIGVCNFNIEHLQALLDQTGVLPVVNQIELHPRFQQAELRDFHASQDVITQAWSPLGQGRLWGEPLLKSLAQKHRKSVAQIILRWHIQLGNMVIPKTESRTRLQENMAVFDFKLDDDDMAAIATLDRDDGRIGPDPEQFHP